MFPTLIDLGTVDLPYFGETHLFLPTYGVLFAAGAMLAWWWFVRRARQLDVPEAHAFNVAFYGLLGGILGAKLLLVLVDWRFYLSNPVEILGTLRSAGVLIGGVILGGLTFSAYALRHGLPLWKLGDAIVAPLALGQAVGRLGCFAGGCCWGHPAGEASRFAITFTNPDAAAYTGVPLNVPLVPTQLIQMVNDLGLALILALLWRKRIAPPGTVFWIYVLLYSLSRGIIEFWRGDVQRGLYFGGQVSTSQLFAGAGFLVAVAMIVLGRLRRHAAVEA